MPPLKWLNNNELDQLVKRIVEREQRVILGQDASEDDIKEGLRLGGLATKEQVEASQEATKVLTDYNTPRETGRVFPPNVTHLRNLEQVDTWIYLRHIGFRMNSDYGSPNKRYYFPIVKLLKNRSPKLPPTMHDFRKEIKEMTKEDEAKAREIREEEEKMDKEEKTDKEVKGLRHKNEERRQRENEERRQRENEERRRRGLPVLRGGRGGQGRFPQH